jgi:uncharacterized membrane protein YciS (DUF1049 family)
MVGYAHTRNADGQAERLRLDLSFLAGGLHLPWVTMVFLTGFLIEAMLAGRLWLQLNNEDADATGLKALLVSVTDFLVSPFRGYESTVLTERSSGVFEFSTLVAVEAYLIGTLAIVLTIVAIRFMSFFTEQAVAVRKRQELRARTRIKLQRRTPVPVHDTSADKPALSPAISTTPAPEVSASSAPASAPALSGRLPASGRAASNASQHAEVNQ